MKQHSIFYNFIMNIVLTMSSYMFPLITFPYISRILLPAGTGKVSFATSIVSYFVLVAQLGIPIYGIRACAKVRDDQEEFNKNVQEILLINIIMCIIAYILFALSLFCVPRFREEKKLLIVTSASILLTTLGAEWVFKALEMYSYITWRSIFFKTIALAAMFFLVHKQEDYIIYGAISIFASSASNILNFIYLHKLVDFQKRFKLDLKKHMKPIFVFFAMSCATTVYLQLDTVMLGFIKTDVDVGYYNAAVKIKNMLLSIVTSLGAVLLPRVTAYLEKQENEKFKNLSVKVIRFILFISIPMLVYFTMFARPVILLLSGTAYEGAIFPMQLIMPTLLFIGLTNLMGIQILVPMGKERKVLASTIVGAVIDFGLNMILIPRYSSAGAAIGTMVAEIAVFVYQYFSDLDIFKKLFCNINLWKFIISTAVAAIASIWVLKLEAGCFWILLISAICFSSIYLLSLLLMKEIFVQEIIEMIQRSIASLSRERT